MGGRWSEETPMVQLGSSEREKQTEAPRDGKGYFSVTEQAWTHHSMTKTCALVARTCWRPAKEINLRGHVHVVV